MKKRKIRQLTEAPQTMTNRYEPDAYPRKSFYGKAKVTEYNIESDNRKGGYYKLEVLQSYNTPVLAKLTNYITKQCVYVAYHYTSVTTLKHIASFSGMNKSAYLDVPKSRVLEWANGTLSNIELQNLVNEMLQVAEDEGIDMSYENY